MNVLVVLPMLLPFCLFFEKMCWMQSWSLQDEWKRTLTHFVWALWKKVVGFFFQGELK